MRKGTHHYLIRDPFQADRDFHSRQLVISAIRQSKNAPENVRNVNDVVLEIGHVTMPFGRGGERRARVNPRRRRLNSRLPQVEG
jgi:hypothetical protein